MKGRILANPELEGSHVRLTEASGRYVVALTLGGCETSVLVLGALVLGLGISSWGLLLAAAWFPECCTLLGGTHSSSDLVADPLLLIGSNTELDSVLESPHCSHQSCRGS